MSGSSLKTALVALGASVCILAIDVQIAEAKRLGGGTSRGMQRQIQPAPPTQTVQSAAPTRNATAAGGVSSPTPQPTPQRSWLGPLAGLAAGLGIGALLAGGGSSGVLGPILLALVALLGITTVLRLFRGRAPTPAPEPLQYAGVGGPSLGPIPEMRPSSPADIAPVVASAAVATVDRRIPEGFDSDSFLQVAKQNFLCLQEANDRCDTTAIGEFTTAELFAEICDEINARGCSPQRTDVVTLDAELLEVVTEGPRHVASVRYRGLSREESDAAAAPFDEIWHLVKPGDGSDGWRVAGIQQVV